MSVHSLTPRENRERARVRNIFKYLEKNTIFNEHPVLALVLIVMVFGKYWNYIHFFKIFFLLERSKISKIVKYSDVTKEE